MARVNHKKVKQLLNEKRSKITDRQFFSSRILAGYFEDLAAAQTRRYHYNRRVRVQLCWAPRGNTVACTDNLSVIINTGHPMVTAVKGRENRFQIILGLFAHELGHVLYTDFLASQTYANSLERGRWYPEDPVWPTTADSRREQDFWEYLKEDPKNGEVIRQIVHFISNVLEDGYIENRILAQFPGSLGYGLEQLRALQLEQIPTVTQLIEREENGDQTFFESILQMLLSYAKYGQIKYGDEPLSDPRVQLVFSLIAAVDEVLLNPSGKERLRATSLVLIRCWDSVKELAEKIKEKEKELEAAGNFEGISAAAGAVLISVAGSTARGEGSTSVAEGAAPKILSVTAAAREETRKESGAAVKAESDRPKEKPDLAEAEGSVLCEEKDENQTRLDAEGLELTPLEGTAKSTVQEDETGRIPLTHTESCEGAGGDGSVEHNREYQREQNDRAAEDIERILDRMAEKAAAQELESERLRELNDAAQSISYGDIHQGIPIRVNRITDVDEELVDQYNAVSGPLLTISRQLQRNLVRQLKEERRGGKMTGLLMGRRLETHALHRQDGKVFCKNTLPSEMPELAVALLLDESGSMSSADRATYARASAIILYDFCQSLDIPVMVYGHSTGYGETVELYSYAEFESFDRDDKYRLMDIDARASNRDGAALRFVAEQLLRRRETVKLLILVSDGQPAAGGYYGTAAEEDLRGIKQEYRRKGILFVAAAIGDDKPSIERIYGDSFLDITDLNQLPTRLTAVVKRHINI